MTILGDMEDRFCAAFARSWKMTAAELAGAGIRMGADVRNKNGDLYRITTIEPRVHNFGAPAGAITINGVKYRADGTWGTREHWVGDLAELTVE